MNKFYCSIVIVFLSVYILISCDVRPKLPYITNYDFYNSLFYDNDSILQGRTRVCDSTVNHSFFLTINADDIRIETPEFIVISMGRLLYRGSKTKRIETVKLNVCLSEDEWESIDVIVLDHAKHQAYNFVDMWKNSYIIGDLEEVRVFIYTNGTCKIVNDNWLYKLIYD